MYVQRVKQKKDIKEVIDTLQLLLKIKHFVPNNMGIEEFVILEEGEEHKFIHICNLDNFIKYAEESFIAPAKLEATLEERMNGSLSRIMFLCSYGTVMVGPAGVGQCNRCKSNFPSIKVFELLLLDKSF